MSPVEPLPVDNGESNENARMAALEHDEDEHR